MYGHCGIEDLSRQRRMPMVVAELLSYNADIICLQEIDASIHDSLLRPVLEANGYQGFYTNKVTFQCQSLLLLSIVLPH
jgi:mRNA deadenylase 3'-5' endonuclease subunit Ccr4